MTATQQVLLNRGISVDTQDEWLNPSRDDIAEPFALGRRKLQQIEAIICSAFYKQEKIAVVVDPDTDGYTSAAILFNGLEKFFPGVHEFLVPIHHKGKAHGFSDVLDEIIAVSPALAITPDGGSNDIEAHKKLNDMGIIPIVLDHHEIDINPDDSPAIIVNVQNSEYENKSLTGAGVVWQLLREWVLSCIDEERATQLAQDVDDLLDLCAVGNIGDMADYRKKETRAIAKCGLANLKNKFIYHMAFKHTYSIEQMNGLNYLSCAFYIAPYINAVTRSGTMEEKNTVFTAMLDVYADTMVTPSSKRERRSQIPLYEEAVTVSERVKRRQTSDQNEAMEFFENQIEEEKLTDNAIILCHCEDGAIAPSLAGLIANKLQAKYQHPTMVLRDTGDELVGSARNYSLCEVEDMKGVCSATGLMTLAAGHSKAFGAGVLKSNVSEFIKKTNEAYKGISWTPTYYVDYVWEPEKIDADKILEIGRMDIFGQEIPESLVFVFNIRLKPQMLTLMGKNKDTIKISLPNGVAAIMFRQSEELYNEMCDDDMYLNIVCKPKVNEWQGTITPQLIVEDYDLWWDYTF